MLRGRIETLLAAGERAGTFLERPAARLLDGPHAHEDLSGRVVSAGLSVDETAEALGISPARVKRDWATARLWLYEELQTADE